MTVKDTLKEMVLTYPRIFNSKLSLYNHLFLTVGNGYVWFNGELCDSIINDFQIIEKSNENMINDYQIIEKSIENVLTDNFSYDLMDPYLDTCEETKSIIEYFKIFNKNRLKEIKTILNVDDIINENLEYSLLKKQDEEMLGEPFLYPLSQYSAILNIPNDIKNDWKEAIKEFYNFIIKSQDENIIKYKEKNSDLLNIIKL
jgi:hypothetical protein